MIQKTNCTIGMRVRFGNPNGEKTVGEIVKLNPKNAKIKTLEKRGNRNYSGETWNVSYSLLYPATGDIVQHNAVDSPIKYNQFDPPEDQLILEAILQCHIALSPECLTGDGELPRNVIQQRYRELTLKLTRLQEAYGRPVSESVAWDWMEQQRKHNQETHKN